MFHVLATAVLFAHPVPLQTGPPPGQVILDHIVRTVYSTKIWQSDIRQARLLKLCGPGPESDDATLMQLENRILILAELNRAPAADPTPEELATHRQAWEASVAAQGALDGLLVKAGMNARELQAWHRDDVRIRKYLDQRFGKLPTDQRSLRTQEWVNDLRLRAGLKRE